MNVVVAQGVAIPFLGSSLGAALAFLLRRAMPEKLRKALAGSR